MKGDEIDDIIKECSMKVWGALNDPEARDAFGVLEYILKRYRKIVGPSTEPTVYSAGLLEMLEGMNRELYEKVMECIRMNIPDSFLKE